MVSAVPVSKIALPVVVAVDHADNFYSVVEHAINDQMAFVYLDADAGLDF